MINAVDSFGFLFQTPHQNNELNSLSADLNREFIGPSKKLGVPHIMVRPINPSRLAEHCGKAKPTGYALWRDRIPPSFFDVLF